MSPQDRPTPQSPDMIDLEIGGDKVESSAMSSVPDGELDGKRDAETRVTSGMPSFATQDKEPEWAHGFQLFNILTAVSFVCFLMLLDGTIVVAAVPRITDDFNSLGDIGWYGAAYQLGRYVNWTIN